MSESRRHSQIYPIYNQINVEKLRTELKFSDEDFAILESVLKIGRFGIPLENMLKEIKLIHFKERPIETIYDPFHRWGGRLVVFLALANLLGTQRIIGNDLNVHLQAPYNVIYQIARLVLEQQGLRAPEVKFLNKDAAQITMDEVADQSVDLVLTSPPYIDMISYEKKETTIEKLIPCFERTFEKLKRGTGIACFWVSRKTAEAIRNSFPMDKYSIYQGSKFALRLLAPPATQIKLHSAHSKSFTQEPIVFQSISAIIDIPNPIPLSQAATSDELDVTLAPPVAAANDENNFPISAMTIKPITAVLQNRSLLFKKRQAESDTITLSKKPFPNNDEEKTTDCLMY